MMESLLLHTGGGFYIAHEAAWKTNSTFKLGAVIVKGGSIISIGFNRNEGHPAAYYGSTFHAEYDAIRKAPSSIKGTKMFVYRFARKDGSLKDSKPCILCQKEIAKVGISSVTFMEDNKILRESFKETKVTSWYTKHTYFNTSCCYTT